MNILWATSGGFFGVTLALVIAFVMIRRWVQWKIREWMGAAHRAGICPVCKQSVQHRGPPPDDPNDSGGFTVPHAPPSPPA
jgi:hypothetical protein